MRFSRPTIYFLLSLVILTFSGGLAQAKNNKGHMKHRGMDQNGDGVITRDEWRGNETSFNNQDWNGDGLLSGDELRPGVKHYRGTHLSTSTTRYGALDRNNDGVISPSEWTGTMQEFNRLDQDGNGILSVGEYNQQGTSATSDRFRVLDYNNNGFVTRDEWNNTTRLFDQLDSNGDGRLSRTEFYNEARIPIAVFSELDVNNDGHITRSEWRSDTATFNRLDTDRNNVLSENEFNGRQTSSVIDRIFQQIMGK